MTGALSPSHWVVILVVVLLLFGAKRLPDAARGIGRSLRIFKAETSALAEDGDASEKGGAKAVPTAELPATPAAPDAPAESAATPVRTPTNGSTV